MIHGDIEAAGKTDVGRVRERNEDRYALTTLCPATNPPLTEEFGAESDLERPRLLVVADGVGGAPGGEVASDTVVCTLTDHMHRAARLGAWDDADSELLRAAEHAQDSVKEICSTYPALQDMSTTLTAALVHRDHVQVVHAGDSRCYVMRPGRDLVQITHDHTVAQCQVDAGLLTESQAARSPLSHILTNAISGRSEKKPILDLAGCELHDGDSVLVCSDGLTRHLSDARITEIVGECGSANVACAALVAEAKARGGEDNITAVLAFLKSPPPEPPLPASAAIPAHAESTLAAAA